MFQCNLTAPKRAWLTTDLIQTLPPGCVLVMDNSINGTRQTGQSTMQITPSNFCLHLHPPSKHKWAQAKSLCRKGIVQKTTLMESFLSRSAILFCGAELMIESQDIPRLHRQIGDNISNPRKELPPEATLPEQ